MGEFVQDSKVPLSIRRDLLLTFYCKPVIFGNAINDFGKAEMVLIIVRLGIQEKLRNDFAGNMTY